MAEYPRGAALPNGDPSGQQLLQRFLARSSTRMHTMVDTNSFELFVRLLGARQSRLRSNLRSAQSPDRDLASGDIEDPGIPRGKCADKLMGEATASDCVCACRAVGEEAG